MYSFRFGRPLRPAQMGYPSITGLIQAIPDIASIRGNHRTKRMVVLNKVSASIGEMMTRHIPTKSKSSGHFPNNNNSNYNHHHNYYNTGNGVKGKFSYEGNFNNLNGGNNMMMSSPEQVSRWSPK